MLAGYLSVFRMPYAFPTFFFGMVGRIPMAMNTVAIVFLVSDVRDSFFLAGVASSFYTLANAIIGPRAGRLADRFGTRAVILPLVAINAVATGGVVFMVDRSITALLLCAALAGATFPVFGSYTRTRWSRSVTDSRDLGSALSIESVLDETAYIVGPAFAGLLFALMGSQSPLLAGVVFAIMGALGIALSSTDAGGVARLASDHTGGIVRIKYVKTLFISLIGLGLLFGSNFVVIIAVATEVGRASDGGLWVALYPLGSAVSGILYGMVNWKIPSNIRYTVSLAAMTVFTSGILFFQDVDTIAFWIVVSGIAIGPTLISANALLKELVPLSRLNESFALLGASISIGLTLGSTISGFIVSEWGGWSGFFFITASAGVATLISMGAKGFHREKPVLDSSDLT
jgi:MFS family permease